MFQVYIPKIIAGTGAEFLKEKGCEVITGESEVTRRNLSAYDAVLAGGLSGLTYDSDTLKRLDRCRIIASFSAGVEKIDTLEAQRLGIYVTNSGDANSNAVAEHAMFLILACAKNAKKMRIAAEHNAFDIRQVLHNAELEGKVLGLIGCGNIGRRVAAKSAYGFSMSIVGYDRYADRASLPCEIELTDTLDELLARADFISLHVPLTEQTKGFVNAALFNKMKPSAFLINTARGGLVDEAALIAALSGGTIAGAGLDVFETEPLSPCSPLIQMDNVILSPHCAANTREALDRMELYAAQDIWRVLNGETPRFPVNTPAANRM